MEEVRASNVEVLLGCTKTNIIKTETDKALFKIDLWELGLQKLDEMPVASNSPNDGKSNMSKTHMEEIKKEDLAGKKGMSGTE